MRLCATIYIIYILYRYVYNIYLNIYEIIVYFSTYSTFSKLSHETSEKKFEYTFGTYCIGVVIITMCLLVHSYEDLMMP